MKAAAPFVTIVVLSIAFFGGFWRFTQFASEWSDRLGAPNWPSLLLFSTIFAVLIFRRCVQRGFSVPATSSIFLGSFLTLSVLFVGTYAEISRRQAMAEFNADREFQNLFWVSLHNAPTDWQFFLHAGALKDCVPNARSYRTMSMYELTEYVMFSVLPMDWFTECGMKPHYLD